MQCFLRLAASVCEVQLSAQSFEGLKSFAVLVRCPAPWEVVFAEFQGLVGARCLSPTSQRLRSEDNVLRWVQPPAQGSTNQVCSQRQQGLILFDRFLVLFVWVPSFILGT